VNGWAWFWLSWLGVAAVVEAVALIRKAPADTASEAVWRWLKVTPGKTPARAAVWSWRSFALGAFLLWLTLHFLLGWWT
jgi:hypothetical protein